MNSLFSSSSSTEVLYQHMSCGLKVNTQSQDWYKCLQKTLRSIRGINYEIDAEKGIALVSGRVNPYSILKKLMKFKEHAEIAWIKTGKNQAGGYSGDYNTVPYHQWGGDGYWPASGGGGGDGGYDPYYGGGYGYNGQYYDPYGYNWSGSYY